MLKATWQSATLHRFYSLTLSLSTPPPMISAHQLPLRRANFLPNTCIRLHPVSDDPAGVQHRAVVASAKSLADGIEGAFGHVAGEGHNDLARECNLLGAALAGRVRHPAVKIFSDPFFD